MPPDVRPNTYRINFALPVEGIGELVVFDSYPSPGVQHREIMGREVFLFTNTGMPLWQIDPEQGTTEGRTHDFDPAKATDEPFVNAWAADGAYYASRFNGDSFRIDLRTGSAAYSGWART